MSTLIVESLEARLARQLPGASVMRTHALGSAKSWTVVHRERRVSASSLREAVDQALMLWAVTR